MAGLLCAIIFYASRGQSCCTEIRTLLESGAGQSCSALSPTALSPPPPPAPPPFPPPLSSGLSSLLLNAAADTGCDPATPAGPCLGYTGACGDLPTQFSSLQGAYVYGDPGALACHSTLADYVCHAFPDDAYATDQVCESDSLP